METNCYSFYDKEAKVYDIPFYAKSDLFAKRHFLIRLEEKPSMLRTFLDQFELHRIGNFSRETGIFTSEQETVLRGNQIAEEYYKEDQNNA